MILCIFFLYSILDFIFCVFLDNAFAWQLQQQEEEKASISAQQPVTQLQEIMDMEMALALYKADQVFYI